MSTPFDPFFVPPNQLKNRTVPIGSRWVESIAPVADEGEAGQREFLRRIIGVRNFSILFTVLVILFGGLIVRTGYLQIYRGTAFASRADRNRIRLVRIPALRGIITDRNGTVIAKNTARFALIITPADLPHDQLARTKTIADIARLSSVPTETIEEQIKTYERRTPTIAIKDNITHDEMLMLGTAITGIPGVQIETAPRREYPQQSLYSHLLGYVGKLSATEFESHKTQGYQMSDSLGKSGVEATFESTLRGRDGTERAEVDALGKIVGILSTDQPKEGAPLTLAIDGPLQTEARRALSDMLRLRNATAGVAIAMTPDGRIRSIVSLPDFDANVFPEQNNPAISKLLTDATKPMFNRAIAGAYPPGSTIKPLMATAALAEGKITENTSFLSGGGIRIGGWFFPDWRAGGHGNTNVIKAIAESVNTFFYIIGGGYNTFTGLGLDGIVKYAKIFGLGSKTGIDLPGETAGFVPTAQWKKETTGEGWYIGDTYHISIGQGFLLTTPLQMASITAAIANGGTLYTPTVLENPTGDRIKNAAVAPVEAIKTVQRAMRQTVLTGSGRSLLTLPVTSAGKTGTAQRDADKKTLAWYVGYAPYEHPELIITVMVEEGGEGHATAAPIAKAMFGRYFSVAEIPLPPEVTPATPNDTADAPTIGTEEIPHIPIEFDLPEEEQVPGAPAP